VRRLLVLWDVDYTLVDSDGVGRELYQIAFREMFGGQLPQPGSMAGRTDRAIALEVLTLAGVAEPRQRVDAFHLLMAGHAAEMADLVLERSRVLPGAAQAMAALAALAAPPGRDGGPGGRVGPALVQSLLTGNIRALAEVKLRPLGLTDHLDLDAGAYGDAHEIRAELVGVARASAARRYGSDFGGQATVLVGDTPLDVGAALATSARAVGVATGSFTAEDLAAAGAHAVLPDLADTDRAVAAILGSQWPQ
jgi:phosphoglycolate phosphatase-like HAD superfamily hydrolase